MVARFSRTLFAIAVSFSAPGCVMSRVTSGPIIGIPVFSQDSVTRDSTGRKLAALAGVVLDSTSRAGVGGAQLVLRSPTLPNPRFAYTDQRGGFIFGRLEPGTYDILVRRLGFLPFSGAHVFRAGVVDTLTVRIAASTACLCP